MNTSEELRVLLHQAHAANTAGEFGKAENITRKIVSELGVSGLWRDLFCVALLTLSKAVLGGGKTKEALGFAEQSLEIAMQLELKEEEASALVSIGLLYWNLSDYPHALEYLQRGLTIHEELGSKSGMASALGNIGVVYGSLSDYVSALENNLKALAIFEELGNKDGMSKNLGNIGNMYRLLSDFPRALEYLQKALEINTEIGREAGMASNLGTMGIVYGNLSDYHLSLDCLKSALALYEKLGRKSGMASTLGNIGNVYNACLDYSRALEYYQKALEIYQSLEIKDGIATNLGNIGSVYANKNFEGYDPKKGEEFLLQATAILEELGSKKEQYEFLLSLAELYSAQHSWQKAFEYYQLFHVLEKEVQSDEAKKQSQLFAINRDFAVIKREQEVLHLKNAELSKMNTLLEGTLQELRAVQSELIRSERETASANVKLSEKNYLLEDALDELRTVQKDLMRSERQSAFANIKLSEKNEELEEKNILLRRLNEEKNEFLGIAAHDLKNPLTSIVTTSQLLRRYANGLTHEKLSEKLRTIEQSATYMRGIIINLLDVNTIESGAFSVHRSQIDIANFTKNVAESYRERAEVKDITLTFQEMGRAVGFADENALMQVLENLISNALKYSPFGKNVHISVEKLG